MLRRAKSGIASLAALAVMAVQVFGVNRVYWCPCHGGGEVVETFECEGGNSHHGILHFDGCHDDDDDDHDDGHHAGEWDLECEDHDDHDSTPAHGHKHEVVREAASYHAPGAAAIPDLLLLETLLDWIQPFASLVLGESQEWTPRPVWEPWRSPPPTWVSVVRATVLMV